jgi:hypothetical protein
MYHYRYFNPFQELVHKSSEYFINSTNVVLAYTMYNNINI